MWRRAYKQTKNALRQGFDKLRNLKKEDLHNPKIKEITDMVEERSEKMLITTNKYISDFKSQNPHLGILNILNDKFESHCFYRSIEFLRKFFDK